MMNIGMVGLDTSHPGSFARRLNRMNGVRVAGAVDRGSAAPQRLAEFCRDSGAAAFPTVGELAGRCDAVMVLARDWNTHLADLEILMRMGVPCYCDKPLFGSHAEVERFLAVAEETGTLFFGGSGWRWNSLTRKIFEENRDREIAGVFMTGQNDLFYYGIHAAEWLLGLLGPGVEAVEDQGRCRTMRSVRVVHRRCREIELLLETSPAIGRRCWLTVDHRDLFLQLDLDLIHDGICETFVNMVKTGEQPAAYRDYVESVLVLLALQESILTGKPARPKTAGGVDR